MARPKAIGIPWYKCNAMLEDDIEFKKIMLKYPRAFEIYHRTCSRLCKQPQQSIKWDDETLLWLADELRETPDNLKTIITVFVENGYMNISDGLLHNDDVNESAICINSERERQRKKNTKNGFTGGNTDGNTTGNTVCFTDKQYSRTETVETEKKETEKESAERKTQDGKTQKPFLLLIGIGNGSVNPMEIFMSAYKHYRHREYDKEPGDKSKLEDICRYCKSQEIYYEFLQWFFGQSDDFLRKKNWNIFSAHHKMQYFNVKEEPEELMPWEEDVI